MTKITNLDSEKIKQLISESCKDGWLYIGEKGEGNCRYALGELGKNPLIYIGISPKLSTVDNLDTTINIIKYHVNTSKEYDGWIALNLYPYIGAVTKFYPPELDELQQNALAINSLIAKAIIELYPNSTILAAWGALIAKRDYLKDLLRTCVPITKPELWVCKSDVRCRHSHPHSVLFVPRTDNLIAFDIMKYCADMKIL